MFVSAINLNQMTPFGGGYGGSSPLTDDGFDLNREFEPEQEDFVEAGFLSGATHGFCADNYEPNPNYELYARHRLRLPQYGTLTAAVELLRSKQRIVVLSGAGVSVSAGIPDFRSEDGLYSLVRKELPNLEDPTDLFDLATFRANPAMFYSFAHRIFDPTAKRKPSFAHRFIKALERNGQLHRNYSQNIDGLEAAAGITRAIQAHGTFDRFHCHFGCGRRYTANPAILEAIASRTVPYCPCCGHPLKPDIVFFGEDLTAEFDTTIDGDLATADLLIVMGSSLKVDPVASIVRDLPPHVPQILINREVVAVPHEFDLCLLGECDDVVVKLMTMLGWLYTNGDCEAGGTRLRARGDGIYRCCM